MLGTMINFSAMLKPSAFATIALTLFVILFVPGIFVDGMFFDGVTYAAISRNLAEGKGSFIDLYYSATVPHFREHPPLIFLIQGFFFWIFGDHFYTEKLFSLAIAVTAVVSMISLGKAVKVIKQDNWWLALILWLLVPVVSWSYRNNLLEASMSVFCLAATTAMFHAFRKQNGYYLILSALMICLAGLSKGFTGLFPLCIPALYGIIYKNYREGIVYQLVLLVFAAIFGCLIIFCIPGMKAFLAGYIDAQILPSLQGKRDAIEGSRLWIAGKLITELAIPLVLLLISLILIRKKSIQLSTENKQVFLLLILIGLSASLPMMISPKQRAYYLIPAIPYFILAFTIYISPLITQLNEKINSLWNRIILILCSGTAATLLVLAIVNIGKVSRDKDLVSDINTIAKVVPANSFVQATPMVYENWSLHANLARRTEISLSWDSTTTYILVDKSEVGNYPKLEPTHTELKGFELLKRK